MAFEQCGMPQFQEYEKKHKRILKLLQNTPHFQAWLLRFFNLSLLFAGIYNSGAVCHPSSRRESNACKLLPIFYFLLYLFWAAFTFCIFNYQGNIHRCLILMLYHIPKCYLSPTTFVQKQRESIVAQTQITLYFSYYAWMYLKFFFKKMCNYTEQ